MYKRQASVVRNNCGRSVRCPAKEACCTASAPSVPLVTSLCNVSGTTATLKWAQSSWGVVCPAGTATGTFDVYADTSSNPTTKVCSGLSATTTSCVLNNVTPGTLYNWKVVATNNGGATASSGINACPIPVIAKDWYTSIGGDTYAPGISTTIPTTTWSPKAIGYTLSSIFSSGNTNSSVTNGTVVSNISTGIWVDRMPTKSMWNTFKSTFDVPSTAIPVPSNFAGLNPNKVYKFSGNISSATNYTLSSDGVAVVYVENSDTFTINADFKSASPTKRILFITNSKVSIGSGVSTVAPTTTSSANIQAGIITSNSIMFEKATANPSIVIEGPLVAQGTIGFKRDAYTTHGYPTEVVLYNPYFLSKLTSQERASLDATPSYTGLTTSDVIWEGDL